MNKLVATRGLQASGKTSWARDWVREDPKNRVRVERDELREMLGFGFVKENERHVTEVRNQIVETFLKAGKSVVVSDTNFPWKTLRELRSIARRVGAEFEVKDFTDVPVGECIRRDAYRDPYLGERPPVGEKVIQDFHDRYIKGNDLPLPLPPEDDVKWEKYNLADHWELPFAIIVDIDGTLAEMNGRSPYDWDRVSSDFVRESVADHVATVYHSDRGGTRIILLSGRDGSARADTEWWLDNHEIPYHELHMRAEGDMRKDDVVKYELFNEHVRNKYRVRYVLDDRDSVVKLWRDMGLDCWQVNYGDF
jgi:predicted kinase